MGPRFALVVHLLLDTEGIIVNFVILPLIKFDVASTTRWMSTLGLILLDFNTMTMEFI